MSIFGEQNNDTKEEETISNLDSQYLIAQVGTPLKKALSEIVQKQPEDPIEYLASWLYRHNEAKLEMKREKERLQLIMEAEIEKMKKMACLEEERRLVKQKRRELYEKRREERRRIREEERRKREIEEARLKSLQSPEKKDENGQTALHRLAGEQDADFTHLDRMAHLLADRDAEYRTPRDVAQQMGYETNLAEIDKHVLSLFQKGDLPALRHLLLNCYDYFQLALDHKLENESLPDHSNVFINTIGETLEKINSIFCAVQEKDEEATEKLLEKLPQLATSKNHFGHSLLHVAILFDNISAVNRILEINPEAANIADNLNRNPLHWAFALSEPISEVLLENRTMDSLLDIMMKTPADYKADPTEILKLKECYGVPTPPKDPPPITTEEPNEEEERDPEATNAQESQ